MTSVKEIAQLFNKEYEAMDQAESNGGDTTERRFKVMDKHIQHLEEVMTQLEFKLANLSDENNELRICLQQTDDTLACMRDHRLKSDREIECLNKALREVEAEETNLNTKGIHRPRRAEHTEEDAKNGKHNMNTYPRKQSEEDARIEQINKDLYVSKLLLTIDDLMNDNEELLSELTCLSEGLKTFCKDQKDSDKIKREMEEKIQDLEDQIIILKKSEQPSHEQDMNDKSKEELIKEVAVLTSELCQCRDDKAEVSKCIKQFEEIVLSVEAELVQKNKEVDYLIRSLDRSRDWAGVCTCEPAASNTSTQGPKAKVDTQQQQRCPEACVSSRHLDTEAMVSYTNERNMRFDKALGIPKFVKAPVGRKQ